MKNQKNKYAIIKDQSGEGYYFVDVEKDTGIQDLVYPEVLLAMYPDGKEVRIVEAKEFFLERAIVSAMNSMPKSLVDLAYAIGDMDEKMIASIVEKYNNAAVCAKEALESNDIGEYDEACRLMAVMGRMLRKEPFYLEKE